MPDLGASIRHKTVAARPGLHQDFMRRSQPAGASGLESAYLLLCTAASIVRSIFKKPGWGVAARYILLVREG